MATQAMSRHAVSARAMSARAMSARALLARGTSARAMSARRGMTRGTPAVGAVARGAATQGAATWADVGAAVGGRSAARARQTRGKAWVPAGGPGRRGVRSTGRRPGVRLTRRGRAVLLIFFLVLASAAGLVASPAIQAVADPADRPASTVVQAGDSLWSIAARYLPSDDPFAMIEAIRRVNRLPGYTIYAGERLTLPRR